MGKTFKDGDRKHAEMYKRIKKLREQSRGKKREYIDMSSQTNKYQTTH